MRWVWMQIDMGVKRREQGDTYPHFWKWTAMSLNSSSGMVETATLWIKILENGSDFTTDHPVFNLFLDLKVSPGSLSLLGFLCSSFWSKSSLRLLRSCRRYMENFHYRKTRVHLEFLSKFYSFSKVTEFHTDHTSLYVTGMSSPQDCWQENFTNMIIAGSWL